MGRIGGLICVLLLLPALCFGQDYCISSGTKAQSTADTVAISTIPTKLCGVIITTTAGNNANVIVYDDIADNKTGTVLFDMWVIGDNLSGGAIYAAPIASQTGLYLDFNGCSGCTAEVYYRP